MKIAIYTICLNEEQFAQRFMDTCKGADGVFVTDTGLIDFGIHMFGIIFQMVVKGLHFSMTK
jgi:hypothetical protein